MTNTVPLAQLMDGQIASLRHWAKGRTREAGSPAPIRWHRKPDGGVRTVVGGTIGYRSIATTTRPFWDRKVASTSHRAETNG